MEIELGDRDDSFRPSWGSDRFSAGVYGGEGDDSITLGPGLSGGRGSWGYGGPGNDLLTSAAVPGGPANILLGEDGNDHFETDNGVEDAAICGAGDDYAHVDGQPADSAIDCETVVRGSLYR